MRTRQIFSKKLPYRVREANFISFVFKFFDSFTKVNILFLWYNNHMHNKIQEQIKDAMRAKDQVRLTTLRGVLATFTNEAVAKGKTPQDKLSDDEAIAVLRRLVKQRKDSIDQFEKGGRPELAESEKAEMVILEEFLPAQMSEEKIREIVLKKKEEMGAVDKSKMGIFMGAVMKETAGQADGSLVKKIVEEVLG